MPFTANTLRHFFRFFHKNLSSSEIELLLKGSKHGQWAVSAEVKKQLSIIKHYQWLFKFVPGLSAVFFCNTLAFRASNANSDIDLFIVSKNGQIWICRIFTTLICHLLGIRRYNDKIANRFCLSFFATENGAKNLHNLQITDQADFYLAVWVATLDCIWYKPDFLDQFIEANQWIKNYGLQFVNLTNAQKLSSLPLILGNICQKMGLENLFKKIFLARTIKKSCQLKNKQGTIISDDYLKFHNQDIRLQVSRYLSNFSG